MKYKLMITYDIQDMEGNSQVPSEFMRGFEALLPTADTSKISYSFLFSNIWLVLQYLRSQACQDDKIRLQILSKALEAFSQTTHPNDLTSEQHIRRFHSQILEMESNQNGCPLTQSPIEYYGFDASNHQGKHKNHDLLDRLKIGSPE